MEQRSNDVATRDAQTKPGEEEFVRGTGHKSSTNDAAVKDAQT